MRMSKTRKKWKQNNGKCGRKEHIAACQTIDKARAGMLKLYCIRMPVCEFFRKKMGESYVGWDRE